MSPGESPQLPHPETTSGGWQGQAERQRLNAAIRQMQAGDGFAQRMFRFYRCRTHKTGLLRSFKADRSQGLSPDAVIIHAGAQRESALPDLGETMAGIETLRTCIVVEHG